MTRARERQPSRSAPSAALAACLLVTLSACSSTLDSLGKDPQAVTTTDSGVPAPLSPLTGPTSYNDAFRDLIGKSDTDIAAKLAAAFAQLFHGDMSTQAIYFTVGTDQADIQDLFHGDIRTEGIGVAMIVAVELDKQDEFDRLWNYAKTQLARTDVRPRARLFHVRVRRHDALPRPLWDGAVRDRALIREGSLGSDGGDLVCKRTLPACSI